MAKPSTPAAVGLTVPTIVKLLFINGDGKLLLLRRSQTDTRRPGGWDLPGGNVEEGEDLKAALVRETMEEAGIKIHKPVAVFGYSEPRLPYGFPTWVFFAERVRAVPAVSLSYEHDEYQWLTLEEALDIVDYGLHQRVLQYVSDNKILSLLP